MKLIDVAPAARVIIAAAICVVSDRDCTCRPRFAKRAFDDFFEIGRDLSVSFVIVAGQRAQ